MREPVWFYEAQGDEEAGPIPADHLRQLAESGAVTPDTLVRKGIGGKWVPARKVRGLDFRAKAEPPTVAGRVSSALGWIAKKDKLSFPVLALVISAVAMAAINKEIADKQRTETPSLIGREGTVAKPLLMDSVFALPTDEETLRLMEYRKNQKPDEEQPAWVKEASGRLMSRMVKIPAGRRVRILGEYDLPYGKRAFRCVLLEGTREGQQVLIAANDISG